MVVLQVLENNHASDHAKHIQARLPEGHSALEEFSEQSSAARLVTSAAWQRPLTDTDIVQSLHDSVQSFDTKGEAHPSIVTALVLIGKLELIESDDLKRWVSSHIQSGGQGKRWRAICWLSKTAEGRMILMRHLKTRSNYGILERAMAAALVLRVSATEETRRYDFVSQSECKMIHALTSRVDAAQSNGN